MIYVIGKECIDALDRSCVDVCPVDCIYEGERKNYINASECIDCGACELACPEVAIFPARRAKGDEDRETFAADNLAFFELPLPGRTGTARQPRRGRGARRRSASTHPSSPTGGSPAASATGADPLPHAQQHVVEPRQHPLADRAPVVAPFDGEPRLHRVRVGA